jgi:hypothetical protein
MRLTTILALAITCIVMLPDSVPRELKKPEPIQKVSQRGCEYELWVADKYGGHFEDHQEGWRWGCVRPGMAVGSKYFSYRDIVAPTAHNVTMIWLLPDGKTTKYCEWIASR